MRRQLKRALGWAFLASGLYRLALRNKAIIVLFHRVDDTIPDDPIGCSRAVFRAYCDLFRRYFHVVSLSELIGRLMRGEDVGRHLVITFDDGYRDNLEVAAAELERMDLPACFFVTTDYVGTDWVAPWDQACGIRSRWMTWDDVRHLRRKGFEIGAHTMTHCDLGRTEPRNAAWELAGSRARLERELGEEIGLFSYPFGQRGNITPENRAEVRRAGFACCLSAFGGVVTRDSNPYHLARFPISSYHISPHQFAFEIMVERPRGPISARALVGSHRPLGVAE